MRVAAALLAVALGLAVPPYPAGAQGAPPSSPIALVRLARARETQAFTQRHFLHFVGGPDCARSVAISLARDDELRDMTDAWYLVSQIWADLALARTGDEAALCEALRGLTFLEWFWDTRKPEGGYFPRLDIQGVQLQSSDKYVDDNAYAGMLWLEVARLATTPHERALALGRATAIADWLISAGVWDEVFGGGFWWNDRHGDSIEGKPAQTNALAAAELLGVYESTGAGRYRAWAVRTLQWLDNRLWDSEASLYRYSVHYQDLVERQGEVVEDRFFNYDQGIAIEALLVAERLFDGRGAFSGRARAIAERIDPTFWDPALGGYRLEAGVPGVFVVYSAWLTPSFLALYAFDHDPRWLDRARGNTDALNARAWDAGNGGYFQRFYACQDLTAPGCQSGASAVVDPVKHSVSQAWMQRALATLCLFD
ncbi:MAG: AGE family epimerase/isomerase [Chloroflexi bacterium]|nr:AGE family epimerase/isomerase [Chloroflexota bacterium]